LRRVLWKLAKSVTAGQVTVMRIDCVLGRVFAKRNHGRSRWLRISLDVLAVLLVGSYFLVDANLKRIDVVAEHDRRPTDGPGQDWLLVDSDRSDIGRERRPSSANGTAVPRIDSMRLLHLPHSGGRPILIGLPPNAYRWDPTYDSRMFEAAFERGGPKLLVASIEGAIGVRIDRYLEFPSAMRTGARGAGIIRFITIDKADHLHHLIELAFALHKVGEGDAVRVRLPIARSATIDGVGSVQLIDDAKIRMLASAIAADRPIPASLLEH
jgi:hypothetical protein